jgi:uncharacterized protein
MTDVSVLLLGGSFCGLLAGAAAQFGRLCTFSAIEDAVMAGDYRRGRAFALALVTALLLTQTLAGFKLIDLTGNPYNQPQIELAGLIIGASLFGFGMALVGTCGFGLLLRAGTGDLRAIVSAGILGIAAAAATGGLLALVRLWVAGLVTLRTELLGWDGVRKTSRELIGLPANAVVTAMTVIAFLALIFGSARFRKRTQLIIAGVLLGAAVAAGWVVTGALTDPFGIRRPESLTFVGPIARVVLLTMGETIYLATFAVGSVLGVVAGSFAVAWKRDELRWEAFDDQREMRRHILGASFMGFGGVLTKGCTIGQGLSAASTLAVTAPVAIVFMVLGARAGLSYLVGHRPLLGRWHK